jgi:glucan phosphoethanolaminetransferase (alkaline phosphatase superfamily)
LLLYSVNEKSPLIHILSTNFQGTICDIYTKSPYFIALMVLTLGLLFTLVLFAILNRRITIDYCNTSIILLLVFTETYVLGIIINKLTIESFTSNTIIEESIVIALYASFVAIWITSPAILPLLFDWKVKRKKNSMGSITVNPSTEYTLIEKTYLWVQKKLRYLLAIFCNEEEFRYKELGQSDVF